LLIAPKLPWLPPSSGEADYGATSGNLPGDIHFRGKNTEFHFPVVTCIVVSIVLTVVPNPHFLSLDVLKAFLVRLAPMRDKLGPLMFQFGYLNKKMMPSQQEYLENLGAFVDNLPAGFTWAVETRNPNYLNDTHFAFLREHGLAHVFLQGYYMPPIFALYDKYADQLMDNVVIRLHGPDREGMEEKTGKDWSKIIEARDAELDALAGMLRDLKVRRRSVSVFVNNHFEGCAPLTIERIMGRLPVVA
jgi:uncharacterized protein YecE (DUF72 family)